MAIATIIDIIFIVLTVTSPFTNTSSIGPYRTQYLP